MSPFRIAERSAEDISLLTKHSNGRQRKHPPVTRQEEAELAAVVHCATLRRRQAVQAARQNAKATGNRFQRCTCRDPACDKFHWIETREVQAARNALILSCVPWAIHLVTRLVGKRPRYRRLEDDLLQEAIGVGLPRAVDAFDPARECRLITYCTGIVRHVLRDYLRKMEFAVRLPLDKGCLRQRSLDKAAIVERGSASLDTPWESGDTPAAACADPRDKAASAADTAWEKQVTAWLVQKHLTPRERLVMAWRYAGHTLQRIADRLPNIYRDGAVSKQRVYQICARARRKLREGTAATINGQRRAIEQTAVPADIWEIFGFCGAQDLPESINPPLSVTAAEDGRQE